VTYVLCMKDIFGILVYQALCFILESRNGAVRPPFFKVPVFVEQPSYNNNRKFFSDLFWTLGFRKRGSKVRGGSGGWLRGIALQRNTNYTLHS